MRQKIHLELLEVDSDDVCEGLIEDAWYSECKARRADAKNKARGAGAKNASINSAANALVTTGAALITLAALS